jgi:uncharacterized repeat protein (TIGR01451 family)
MKRLWVIPLLALMLVATLQAIAVGASPPAAPALGITPTPTAPPTTPTPTPGARGDCEPVLVKQVSPSVAGPGDEVLFTISVVNIGRDAAVDAYVVDRMPEYLDILDVQLLPEDQGGEALPRDGQTVRVDLGDLGQDFETTILIRARVRQDVPAQTCIENVAEFFAPNCPSRKAELLCWQLPESGQARSTWLLPAGLVASTLGLILALAVRLRARQIG